VPPEARMRYKGTAVDQALARVRSELDWIAQRRLWAPLSEAQLARYARLMDVEKMLQREASHSVHAES
jgi:hypothetical protein